VSNERPLRSISNASPTFSRHSGTGAADNDSDTSSIVERKPAAPGSKKYDSQKVNLPEIGRGSEQRNNLPPIRQQPASYISSIKKKPGAYRQPNEARIKNNPSNKSITLEQKGPLVVTQQPKKVVMEPRKQYVSPYSKKSFYKSYY
jgi:hypothetical protein